MIVNLKRTYSQKIFQQTMFRFYQVEEFRLNLDENL